MATSSTTSIRWDFSEMRSRSAALPVRLERGLSAIMSKKALDGQSYMRSNASWTDRTGNARNGLFGTDYKAGKTHGLVLYHSVPYGIWLEVRWSGAYAIILPTVQVVGPDVMRLCQGLLGRI